jgi:hypothetical protein
VISGSLGVGGRRGQSQDEGGGAGERERGEAVPRRARIIEARHAWFSL